MVTLERHPDELWTSYLVRRLRAEGFKPTEQDFDVTDLYEADPDGNHTLRLTIDLQQGKLGLLRHLVDEGLEKCLRESRTYGNVQERILQESWMEAVYVERKEYKNPLDFLFYRDGKVKISWVLRESFQDIPLLEKYQHDTVWKAEEVIDDLIRYIHQVGYVEIC